MNHILRSFLLVFATTALVGAADVNLTNVTRAAAIPPGSYVAGTTGLYVRLLPMSLLSTYVETNAVPDLAITMGRSYYTNLGANITVTLTLNASAVESAYMWATNSGGSTYTVTSPSGVSGKDGNKVIYCTNGILTKITWSHYGTLNTNVTAEYFW